MEPATEPVEVHATSGACPICDEHFDDLAAYTAHLADEHDLVDEDGSASSFGLERAAPAADFRPELSVLVIPEALSAPPPRPIGPPPPSRPLGLVALVVALVVGLGALIALAPDRGRGDDQVALRAAEETTTTTAAGSRPANAPSTVTSEVSVPGGGSTSEPGPRDAISSAPTVLSATVRAADQSPTTPVTTAPTITTTTSPPPPAFALPSASGAVVEQCERVKNRLLITYSWRFEGGVGWHAPAAYTADSGRFRDVISVPDHAAITIGSVQVLDPDGNAYDVLLQPALSPSPC